MTRGRVLALAVALAGMAGAGSGLAAALATRDSADAEQRIPRAREVKLKRPPSGLHGQATWRAGERRAAAFSLRDQDGRRVSLASMRRHPLLLTFLDSRCTDRCPVEGRMLGVMLRRMPATQRPAVVVVSVNPDGDTPASIRHAMRTWQLDGPWRRHWLRGTTAELAPVWRRYGMTVEPTTKAVLHGMTVHLIDKRGFERSDYLFPFLPNFVALDLKALARERS